MQPSEGIAHDFFSSCSRCISPCGSTRIAFGRVGNLFFPVSAVVQTCDRRSRSATDRHRNGDGNRDRSAGGGGVQRPR